MREIARRVKGRVHDLRSGNRLALRITVGVGGNLDGSTIGNFLGGEIRSYVGSQHLPMSWMPLYIIPFVLQPVEAGHERSGRRSTLRLMDAPTLCLLLPVAKVRGKTVFAFIAQRGVVSPAGMGSAFGRRACVRKDA